mgnify:CR=1 FL=1
MEEIPQKKMCCLWQQPKRSFHADSAQLSYATADAEAEAKAAAKRQLKDMAATALCERFSVCMSGCLGKAAQGAERTKGMRGMI